MNSLSELIASPLRSSPPSRSSKGGDIQTHFISPAIYQKFKTSRLLPCPSGVALAIISLLRRDDYKIDDLVRLIQSDPVIAGLMLKISNAAMYGHTRPVVSLPKAVATLGTSRVGVLVLGLSLLQSYAKGKCVQFDYQHFWSRSLATAIAARALAPFAKLPAEENFTAGLLCSIGELALASLFPERYGEIISAQRSTTERLALEQQTFGTDHRELGATMLHEWHMPEILVAAVYHCEIPDESDFPGGSRSFVVTQSLHIALALADFCVAKEAERWQMLPNLFVKAAHLGIEGEELSCLADKTFKGWREWGEMLKVQTQDIPPFAHLLASPPPKIIENAAAPSSLPKNRSVLLVTGKASESSELGSFLKSNGFKVQGANSGDDGLNIALSEGPDLILLEMIGPGMDAQTFCLSLRASPVAKDSYIIVICNPEDEAKLAQAVDAGADDFLMRPITNLTLAARLRAAERVMHLQSEVLRERYNLAKSANEWAGSNRRLTVVAMTDLLTRLPNRRHGLDFIAAEWAHALGNKLPVACLMIDIDHFKSINDKHGHQTGDAVLASISSRLKSSARSEDMVFRYGGEEFCIVCPGATRRRALEIAERIRQSVATAGFHTPELNISVTVSIGVAAVSPPYLRNEETLIADADAALYRAKHLGRNRIEIAA